MENTLTEKNRKYVILSFVIAGVACIVGILSMFMPFIANKEIPISSLYWFFFALVAILFPYIKEIAFKDLKVVLNDINAAKDMLRDAKESLDKVKEKIDPTRVELINGYQVYLKNLPAGERMKKIKLLSALYLQGMNLTIMEVKTMLHEVNFYDGKIDNEFTDEYFDALCKFQKETKLNPDGIFGYLSYRNLMDLIIEKRSKPVEK